MRFEAEPRPGRRTGMPHNRGPIMNTRAIRLLAAAATTMVLAGPALADHQWGSYHWSRDSNPVQLRIERQIGAVWTSSLNTAIGQWDQSSVLDLTTGSGNLGVSSKKCNALAGKVLVCSDSYGFRGWLGIASIWASGDHITQATSQMNDSYFNTATYNTDAWRALVMCQEIGHDFGLDHQDEAFDNYNLGTCQDYTNAPEGGIVGGFDYGPSNVAPNSHDYDELEDMYAHLDSGGGGGGGGGNCNPRSPKCNAQDAFTFREVGRAPATSSAGGASETAGLSPAEWGQAIAYDRSGRPDTYVMDVGGGRRKITHVFWVPGYRPPGSH